MLSYRVNTVTNHDTIGEVVQWLKNNVGIMTLDWDTHDGKVYYFSDERNALIFALKWGGDSGNSCL